MHISSIYVVLFRQEGRGGIVDCALCNRMHKRCVHSYGIYKSQLVLGLWQTHNCMFRKIHLDFSFVFFPLCISGILS